MEKIKQAWCRLAHWSSMRFSERPQVRNPKDNHNWQDRVVCDRCGRVHWLKKRFS